VGPSRGLFLAFDPFPDPLAAGRGSVSSPCSTEACQTPKKCMCLNLPEPLARELKNVLSRCHLSGES